MRREILLFVVIILISSFTTNALNNNKRSLGITKVSELPKVDGVLNESIWENTSVAKDFLQYQPYNGKAPSLPTEVKIIYDDQAIYFGAIMYDNSPDSIYKDLGARDAFSGLNADLFTVLISTFHDGVNAVEFMVSASGVQSDGKHNGGSRDSNWDSVWESEVKITEFGWVVEMKIPYSALRFSKEENQTWGIQFRRSIRRYREWSTWNFTDINIQGTINQMGEISGIKNIEPPLRLSVTPYVSVYMENAADENKWNNNFNAGMDLKWGISQSFTLDMILIPDFGQVQSDDEVLNISPYETRYNEKRAFFTEGTELFNKGGIFYSRRIGSTPKNLDDAEDQLKDHEVVKENPIETKLVNSTKISGRTKNGLGVGFLNAMTGVTDAVLEDTIPRIKEIGETDTTFYFSSRKFRTQGFTNYNMLVLDQTLKNNSYISLANTNVMYGEENYTANVTATELKLMNKENSFQIFGSGALSQKYTDQNDFGHKYYLRFSKTKGNFLFNISHNTESDTYDPNDMGYIQKNNESTWGTNLSYNINKPFWKVLHWHNNFSFRYQSLYEPRLYSTCEIGFGTNTTLAKSYLHMGMYVEVKPFNRYDYFEPRVEGYYDLDGSYKRWKQELPRNMTGNFWMSTDYRKMFALDFNFGAWESLDDKQYGFWGAFGPRVRFSDKWLLNYRLSVNMKLNTYGYVNSFDKNDETTIHFGKRDQSTIVNTLNTSYIFNNKMSLNLRVRHYWSRVEYSNYYELQKDGSLGNELAYDTYGREENYNYNAFTVDMKYRWRFAPGSEMAVVWKNAIFKNETEIENNFFDNLNNTFESSQINSISFKILYYLDYQYLIKNK